MISVCIATYNGAPYIKEQIDSILSQLSGDDEVIVSDDGSSDNTLSIIAAMNDARIKIVENKKRKGIIGNFENALYNARGEYIFLSDQDDIWLPDKVKVCVQQLQTADMIVHDATIVDSKGDILNDSFFAHHHSRNGYWNNLLRNSFLGCCIAFKKEFLTYILPIPPIAMHDIWIGLIISRKGKVVFVNMPLIAYRRHENNASTTAEKSNLSLLYRIKYRLELLYYSLSR
ncbi:glycosyltransferase family 2 protein [Porphyromonadaceae bacterium]